MREKKLKHTHKNNQWLEQYILTVGKFPFDENFDALIARTRLFYTRFTLENWAKICFNCKFSQTSSPKNQIEIDLSALFLSNKHVSCLLIHYAALKTTSSFEHFVKNYVVFCQDYIFIAAQFPVCHPFCWSESSQRECPVPSHVLPAQPHRINEHSTVHG